MNVRLTYDVTFLSINATRGNIFPNKYAVKLHLLTISNDPVIQNIAFNRLKFFINEIIQGSLFIHKEHPRLLEIGTLFQNKLVVLPDPAFDQIIGMALYCKLNAILNNEIVIEELSISSAEGDNVWYSIDEDDDFSIFNDTNNGKKKNIFIPWWRRQDIFTIDVKNPTEFNWADIDLSWNQEDNNIDGIEFKAEFEFEPLPIEEQPAEKPKKSRKKTVDSDNNSNIQLDSNTIDSNKNFTPTIINGGKKTDETE